MRSIFLLTAFATVFAGATVQAQDDKDHKDHKEKSDKPKIEGSGNVITRDVYIRQQISISR